MILQIGLLPLKYIYTGNVREHRYSLFAQAVGLTGWDGTNFANESEWLETYTDQVNDAAALYVGASTGGSFFNRRAFAVGISMNQSARWVVQLFLNALKQLILTEPQVARSE